MRFIEHLNPPIGALQALRSVIAGSVRAIEYHVDGFAALRLVSTVVEVIMSKPASRKEVD